MTATDTRPKPAAPLLDSLRRKTGFEVAKSRENYARLIFAPTKVGVRIGLVMGAEERETSAVFNPKTVLVGVAKTALFFVKKRFT